MMYTVSPETAFVLMVTVLCMWAAGAAIGAGVVVYLVRAWMREHR